MPRANFDRLRTALVQLAAHRDQTRAFNLLRQVKEPMIIEAFPEVNEPVKGSLNTVRTVSPGEDLTIGAGALTMFS